MGCGGEEDTEGVLNRVHEVVVSYYLNTVRPDA